MFFAGALALAATAKAMAAPGAGRCHSFGPAPLGCRVVETWPDHLDDGLGDPAQRLARPELMLKATGSHLNN